MQGSQKRVPGRRIVWSYVPQPRRHAPFLFRVVSFVVKNEFLKQERNKKKNWASRFGWASQNRVG